MLYSVVDNLGGRVCVCVLVIQLKAPRTWALGPSYNPRLTCKVTFRDVQRILPKVGLRMTACYKIAARTSIDVILELLAPHAALSNS